MPTDETTDPQREQVPEQGRAAVERRGVPRRPAVPRAARAGEEADSRGRPAAASGVVGPVREGGGRAVLQAGRAALFLEFVCACFDHRLLGLVVAANYGCSSSPAFSVSCLLNAKH